MKIPGPDHPITIDHNSNRVRVTFSGHVIADTTRALTLRESTFSAVQYIPRQDVDMTKFKRTSHSNQCPYKGNASYFSIRAGDRAEENAAWSYESPYPSVARIKDYVAFYPNSVDSIEEIPS